MFNSKMNDHLGYKKNEQMIVIILKKSSFNKSILTENGLLHILVPHDWNSIIEPVIIKKSYSLYIKNMTLSDIKLQWQELYYSVELSESLISQITNDALEEVKIWQYT